MELVIKAAGEGEFLTPTTLHEKLSYDCSYGAVRISIRFLVEAGMIVKQYDGLFCHLVPTKAAYDWFSRSGA